MIQKTKKSISILLSLLMVLSVFGGMALPVYAGDGEPDLSWIDETGAAHTLTYGTDGDLPTATFDAGTENESTIVFDNAWTSTDSFPTESGNYCLMNDIAMGSDWDAWNPDSDKNINVYLNGKTVTDTGTGRFFVLDGYNNNLNLFGDGTFAGNGNTYFVYICNNSTVNMYGGTLTNWHGAICLNGNWDVSRFKMYGGTLTGNVDTEGEPGGSAVRVGNGSEAYIYGGNIINNTSSYGNGGAIAVYEHSEYGETKIVITGGTFSGNTAAGVGGAIYAKPDDQDFIILGNPTFSDNTANGVANDIYLDNGHKMTVAGELTPANPILVDRNTKGIFTRNYALNNTANAETVFASSNTDWVVKQNSGEARLVQPPFYIITLDPGEAEGQAITEASEGGAEYNLPICNFKLPEGKLFSGWSDGTQTYAAGASYTLSEDTTFTAQYVDAVTAYVEPNGGTGETTEFARVLPGSVVTLPACPFKAPEAKMFIGWLNGTETYAVGASYTLNEDTTFKAKWSYGETFSYDLHDQYNDGWDGGAAILVKDKETGDVLYTLRTDGGDLTGTFDIPAGKKVVFEWRSGWADDECSYTVKDSAGNVVFSGSGPLATTEITVSLDAAKAAAKAELEGYKNPDDYRDAQKTDLANEVAAGKDAIDNATDTEAVATALANAKAAIDAIKTDAQLTAEELAAAKEAAKAELEGYKNPDDYRDAQKTELADAIAAGKTAIDAAESIADVNTALEETKAAIDAIKSNAQLTAEELAEAKAKLQDAIDTAKAFFDTIKGNEKCADIADTLDTAIQQGEATLNSDDANEILAKADQLLAVLASVKEQKDTIDAESADKPSKDTFRCGFCDRYETWKDFPAFGWIVSLVHFFVHMAARIGDFT